MKLFILLLTNSFLFQWRWRS